MVTVPNKIAVGLENIDRKPDVDVPRETLDEMQSWAASRSYDDSDMADIHRMREFGEYAVDREHFRGSEDTVTVSTDDRLASLTLSSFLAL